jgi:hypothetical protein
MIFYKHYAHTDIDYFRNNQKYIKRSIFNPKNKPDEEVSISFVTRCMNRLHDLKETLPKNIQDNKNYKNLEFLILDYNSKDGLEEWIKKEMMDQIECGRLNYYRTEEPEFFCPNHSQNITFKLAQNKLVANVDTDNFTHENYSQRLNECAYPYKDKILIVPDNFLLPNSTLLLLKGRFCLYKSDIESLRGFDEDLDDGFGNDDVNFVFRCFLRGFKLIRYEKHFSDDRIDTPDDQKVLYIKNKNFEYMKRFNGSITWEKLKTGTTIVNKNRHWGKATLIKNFKEKIEI